MLPARVANHSSGFGSTCFAKCFFFLISCSLCEASSLVVLEHKKALLLVFLFLIFLHLFIEILSLIAPQDIQDKDRLKGDFMFHTEHVVELVAKLLIQAESLQVMSSSVDVSDR